MDSLPTMVASDALRLFPAMKATNEEAGVQSSKGTYIQGGVIAAHFTNCCHDVGDSVIC